MSNIIKAAKGLVKAGFSVTLTNANKICVLYHWKPYQLRAPTMEELDQWSEKFDVHGLAVICGYNNLEVIDVDCKYDLTGSLFEDLMQAITDALPEVAAKLKVIRTVSGGYHLYYFCDQVEGNQKLALRHTTEAEKAAKHGDLVRVLIETRGIGGYVIAPPTAGYVPIVKGAQVQSITPEQRRDLLDICRSFNEYVVEIKKPAAVRTSSESFALSPWEDYNRRGVADMIQRLQNHHWTIVSQKGDKVIFKRPGDTSSKSSGDFHYGKNLFAVFTTSSIFEPQKGYKPAAVYAMLEHGGDFKASARALLELGYGQKKPRIDGETEKDLYRKKLDGYSEDELINLIQEKEGKDTPDAKALYAQLEQKWGDVISLFWDAHLNSVGQLKVNINRAQFIEFLQQEGGFGLYFYDPNSTIYRIIRVQDNVVAEASTEEMKKFVISYIHDLPDTFDGGVTPKMLEDLIMKQHNSLFNDAFLEFVPRIWPDFLRDTADTAYFPFRNGVIRITRGRPLELVSYSNIDRKIWKRHIIPFDILPDLNSEHGLNEEYYCEFLEFMHKVSGEDHERLYYLISLMGYLLHKFKDREKAVAVILAEETDTEELGGGTGKGILSNALGYLSTMTSMDGKVYKPDKSFLFERISLDTRLISIQDVRKTFDFESMFSIITDGITVEKKNKAELYLPFEDAPKFLISTNYTVPATTNAAIRRQRVFEFAPFFGPKFTPGQHFGHKLFDDWGEAEWNRFYNLMFACVENYLNYGIKDIAMSEKLKLKRIKNGYGDDALSFFTDYLEQKSKDFHPLRELYNNFLMESDQEKKDFSMKRFKKMLEEGAKLFGSTLITMRNRQAENRFEVKIQKSAA